MRMTTPVLIVSVLTSSTFMPQAQSKEVVNMGFNKWVGPNIIPRTVGAWDATAQYQPLFIVGYNGNSYIAMSYVPVGINPTDDVLAGGNGVNGKYWMLCSQFSQQVADLSSAVTSLSNSILAIENQVRTKDKKLLIIGDSNSANPSSRDTWPQQSDIIGRLKLSTVVNAAISGSAFLSYSDNYKPWCVKIDDFATTPANIVVTMLGTNDFIKSPPIGTSLSSQDSNTLIYGIQQYFVKLAAYWPDAEKYVVLPLPNSVVVTDNSYSLNFIRYLIYIYARYYKFNIIDPYYAFNAREGSDYFIDGVHTSLKGATLLADFIVSNILSAANHNFNNYGIIFNPSASNNSLFQDSTNISPTNSEIIMTDTLIFFNLHVSISTLSNGFNQIVTVIPQWMIPIERFSPNCFIVGDELYSVPCRFSNNGLIDIFISDVNLYIDYSYLLLSGVFPNPWSSRIDWNVI